MLLVLEDSRKVQEPKDSEQSEQKGQSSERKEASSKSSEAVSNLVNDVCNSFNQILTNVILQDTLRLLAKLLNLASQKGSVSVKSQHSVLLVAQVVVLVKKEHLLKVESLEDSRKEPSERRQEEQPEASENWEEKQEQQGQSAEPRKVVQSEPSKKVVSARVVVVCLEGDELKDCTQEHPVKRRPPKTPRPKWPPVPNKKKTTSNRSRNDSL